MSDTYSIVLNDTTKFKISDNGVREFKTQIKGVSANAIEFTVNESTSDMIKAKFSSKFNTAIIKMELLLRHLSSMIFLSLLLLI